MLDAHSQPGPAPDPGILERNLIALSRASPEVAALVRRARPRSDVSFHVASDGALSGTIGSPTGERALCSRRRPLEEARRLAESVPIQSAGAVVVLGFALGHHVAALAGRLKRAGVVLVFEPDVELLRAVFERIDHSGWLSESNVAIYTDPDDTTPIAGSISGFEGLVALGVKFLSHPASTARLGDRGERFSEAVTRVVSSVRMTVVTTLVQVQATIRNLLMNVAHYATVPGVADLCGAAAGRAAVVVSAGPSLARNIEQLSRPGVRDRVVIIAVQTVLKTLLEHGIRPHFVTALDYHEISRRFYEGLSAGDVEGVALVAEPKANAAILDAFPGRIRCPADEALDQLLGAELAREMGTITGGATVSHLAYYLARHMGCDPVILIGQDLGFTDGQYYAAGAAIHRVWAGELNDLNTLEMMEWQRIVRGRRTLRSATDVLGRPIYTDEQMATYLMQFERDFAGDRQRGLRIIDATEGGVAKRHTDAMPLGEALDANAGDGRLDLPDPAIGEDRHRTIKRVRERLRRVRQDCWQIARRSRRTERLLEEMIEVHGDQPHVNELIGAVNAIRDEVVRLQPAFSLVDRLNQAGALNRIRADRMIELDESLSPLDRQRRQIERDTKNVRWLGDAADEMGRMLDDAIRVLGGSAKVTRDPPPDDPESDADGGGAPARASRRRRVWAVIPVEPDQTGLGTPRDLAEAFVLGRNPLSLVVERLSRCRRLDGVVLLAQDPSRVGALLGGASGSVRIVGVKAGLISDHARAIRGARLWAGACWRGGLGSLTCYDECLIPSATLAAMDEVGADAAVLVGADWALVDPVLVDRVIERHLERPSSYRLTFTQACPGLGACLVDRSVVLDMAQQRQRVGSWATIGGLLGYVPIAPRSDPIAQPVCVHVDSGLRDAGLRLIPDSPQRRAMLAEALEALGGDVLRAPSEAIVELVARHCATPALPGEIVLEPTATDVGGLRSAWNESPMPAGAVMDPALAQRVLEQACRGGNAPAVTIGAGDSGGGRDPLGGAGFLDLVRVARECGAAGVHVRTDLDVEPGVGEALLGGDVDVVSVDLLAGTAPTYEALTGSDRFDRVVENLKGLIGGRSSVSGIAVPWIVPRITRCDEVYEQIEAFCDQWLLRAGACVIDPLPKAVAGGRIEPLPLPESARRRRQRTRMVVCADGTVRSEVGCGQIVGDLRHEALEAVWARLIAGRGSQTEARQGAGVG